MNHKFESNNIDCVDDKCKLCGYGENKHDN